MRKSPRSVTELFQSPPQALASVLRRVTVLQEIEAVVHGALPPGARTEVKVAACDERGLVLVVSNSGWATRLRYQQNAIRRALAQRMRRHVPQVEIRVRPPAQPAPSVAPPRHMPDSARRQLEITARCVEDPGLRRALEKLAAADSD